MESALSDPMDHAHERLERWQPGPPLAHCRRRRAGGACGGRFYRCFGTGRYGAGAHWAECGLPAVRPFSRGVRHVARATSPLRNTAAAESGRRRLQTELARSWQAALRKQPRSRRGTWCSLRTTAQRKRRPTAAQSWQLGHRSRETESEAHGLRCSVPSWLAPWCDAGTIDGARHLSTNHRTRCATLGKRRVTAAPGLSPVVSNGQGASASLPMPMRRNFASEISSRLGPLGARYPNGGISESKVTRPLPFLRAQLERKRGASTPLS
jgi:hypothetical protein